MLLVPLSRVSTGEQVGGGGLERQSTKAAAYAEQRGWELYPHAYSDEGVSGFSGANLDGDLGRFLADLKAGVFPAGPVALGIEDMDRLSRQFALSFLPVLVDDLLNAGVTLSVMDKGRDISRASIKRNPFELHELLMWMGAAHEFSDKLSGRITSHRQQIRDAIRRGEPVNPGRAPSWIELVDGQWQLTPYADVIRRVVAMAAEGEGAMAIARALNSEKVPSPGTVVARRKKPKAPGKPWDKGSVLQVLKAPALHGARAIGASGHNAALREWKDEVARLRRQGVKEEALPVKPRPTPEPDQEGYYPALLTPGEHAALLASISRRKTVDNGGRRDQVRWIAQTLTRCSCGALMSACSSVSRGHRYTYLRCAGRRDGATRCTAPMLRLGPLQANLLTRLSAETFTALVAQQEGRVAAGAQAVALAERERLQAQVAELQARGLAGEQALAVADDPAVVAVLAKRQAGLEAELQVALQALEHAEHALAELTRSGESVGLAGEARQAVAGLLETFHQGTDQPADRALVNSYLRRLGLRVTIDAAAGAMGLAVGNQEPEWEELNSSLDMAALARGMTGTKAITWEATPEVWELMDRLPRTEEGLIDMSGPFREFFDLSPEHTALAAKITTPRPRGRRP